MKEDSKKPAVARQPDGRKASASPLPTSATTASLANSNPPVGTPSAAQRLVAVELQMGDSSEPVGQAAFRVCEKMRLPLSSLIGVVGFRALFSRALTLATKEVSWLGGVKVGADGVLGFSTETKEQMGSEAAVRGGEALITQLIQLLITFIGEALTLRLVHNIWPKAALTKSESKGKLP